jgi:uracil-DNA glycosylase
MARLAARARRCTLCARELPHGPRPVFRAEHPAPILIVGQAPGRRVHETGIPWNDASGRTLRAWLGVDESIFYNTRIFSIIPTGLCFPGTDRGKGDRPPMPACAPLWQPKFLRWLAPTLQLRLLVGACAIAYHLPECAGRPVGETVGRFRDFLPRGILPLPHPSPRNRKWLRDRPWFERDLVPVLRAEIARCVAHAAGGCRGNEIANDYGDAPAHKT